ncbi:MAG: cysteine synthase A [Bacteroidales bacterium]
MKADNILQLIGNTPHVRINNLFGNDYKVWVKLEKDNPGGSIKDRIALSMIEAAEKDGSLKPGGTIIEPTSGNTGIGLAIVAAVKKYRLILVMPDSMSLERRRVMTAYGAELELTPREGGMKGAIARAHELAGDISGAWVPMQFDNPANPEIHQKATAAEIITDFPDGFDYMVTGVGTGGHITGVGKVLKEKFPAIKIYAVEPALSPVLGGGKPGPHPIQGIGAGFVPSVLDRSVLDGIIQIERDEAFGYAIRTAKEEGIFMGISSGASLAAVARLIKDIDKGSRILSFCYDTGERYLSVPELFT